VILIAVAGDIVLRLVSESDYDQYEMREMSHSYLLILIFFGLILVTLAINLAFQEKAAKFSLAPLRLQRAESGQGETRDSSPPDVQIQTGKTHSRGIVLTVRGGRCKATFRQPSSGLLAFGRFAAIFFGSFVLLLIPFTDQHVPSKGLKIYIPKFGTLFAVNEPWDEPIVVRVAGPNLWYLNRKPVSHGDFAKRLRGILSRRGDKTVFVDADESIFYDWTAEVVSEIQQAWDAKVVLVTPSMKKEDPMLEGQSPCEPVPLHANKMLKPPPEWNEVDRYWYFGHTLVSFMINEHGGVSNVKILEGQAKPDHGALLVHSIERWRFKPLPGCGTQQVVRMM